jgi:thiamine biosynthesis protein ThiS
MAAPDETAPRGVFILNGESRPLPANGCFTTLLESLALRADWVLVELNGEPVLRERYGALRLAPGDRLEIVTPFAGG